MITKVRDENIAILRKSNNLNKPEIFDLFSLDPGIDFYKKPGENNLEILANQIELAVSPYRNKEI